MPMEEKRKKSLANIGEWASSATERKPEPPPMEMPPVSRAMLDALNPKKPPPPINIRLETIRAMDDDALMKWLTTESEHPGRPLDGGSKMAITMELMRRQAADARKPHKPTLWMVAISLAVAVIMGAWQIGKDVREWLQAQPVAAPATQSADPAPQSQTPSQTQSPHK